MVTPNHEIEGIAFHTASVIDIKAPLVNAELGCAKTFVSVVNDNGGCCANFVVVPTAAAAKTMLGNGIDFEFEASCYTPGLVHRKFLNAGILCAASVAEG